MFVATKLKLLNIYLDSETLLLNIHLDSDSS